VPRYAILPNESSNRVYGAVAPELLAAEVVAIAPHFHTGVHDVSVQTLGGIDYVTFDGEEFNDLARFIASNLAGARALFTLSEGRLTPLELAPLEMFASDLVTIQRYAGKTNEQFTHLLVNLTVAASDAALVRAAAGRRVRLLDPVAGRGSTLNRALTYGFDAHGVERNEKEVEQYRTFITTYLKDHRIKHKATSERIRKGEFAGASAFEVDIDRGRQKLRVACGDTVHTKGLHPGTAFDLIVGDLPYGVQHAAAAKTTRRSPIELVQAAAPQWYAALTKDGAIGLAYNLKTMGRSAITEALTDAKFTLVEHPRSFEHTVDRAITRDLIIAIK